MYESLQFLSNICQGTTWRTLAHVAFVVGQITTS